MRFGLFEIAIIVAVAVVLIVIVVLSRGRRPATLVLGELFGDPGPHPGPKAVRWALGVLWEAGVDADSDPAYAAKVLMDAEPRLDRRSAAALVEALR